MSSSLDGPRLAPADGAARRLVVLVHGYGADGNDLIALARQWQTLLPDTAFVAPNAPQRVPGAPMGYQWFPISRIDPAEMQAGVAAAAPVLDGFLDGELDRLGLGPESLALVGFSQGAMLALHLGLSRPRPPAAIVALSGLLPGRVPERSGYPPVFLAHGDRDEVVPVPYLFLAAGALGQARVPHTLHLAQGVGHGIDPQTQTLAGQFLQAAFEGRIAPPA